jgi:nucleotide-binding universal stress UspA family protein
VTSLPPFSRPIVCGVDFSEQSRRTLELAGALAHVLHVPLHVVTAIDPLLNEAAETQYGPGRFVDDAKKELADLMNASRHAPDLEAHVEAIVGDPAPVLLDVGARVAAGLIAVGTQGLGRAHRLVFGSTTQRLMRTTTLPVLAVPEGMTFDSDTAAAGALWFDRIVCGVDFSGPSEAAARAAVALGRKVSVPTTLVHAAGRAAVPQAWNLFAASASDRQTEAADVRLRELAAGLGEVQPAFEVVAGDPAQAIEDRSQSALIVLGLAGASNQRPGTTALRILSLTKRAVLAVPEWDGLKA